MGFVLQSSNLLIRWLSRRDRRREIEDPAPDPWRRRNVRKPASAGRCGGRRPSTNSAQRRPDKAAWRRASAPWRWATSNSTGPTWSGPTSQTETGPGRDELIVELLARMTGTARPSLHGTHNPNVDVRGPRAQAAGRPAGDGARQHRCGPAGVMSAAAVLGGIFLVGTRCCTDGAPPADARRPHSPFARW